MSILIPGPGLLSEVQTHTSTWMSPRNVNSMFGQLAQCLAPSKPSIKMSYYWPSVAFLAPADPPPLATPQWVLRVTYFLSAVLALG